MKEVNQMSTEESGDIAGWFSRYGETLLIVAISRLLVCAIIVFANDVFISYHATTPRSILRVLTHWDGGWYLSVAQNGYEYVPGKQCNIAFFPLYPILIRAGSFVAPNLRLSAVLVSNLCFAGAAVLFQKLVELDYSRTVSRAAVLFLAFTPVSFYFSSAYAESTFLLFALGALYSARREKWLIAGICGMFLTATRNIGFWIAVPLFIEYVRQYWRPEAGIRSLIRPQAAALALVPLGLISFMAYCYLRFGDPLIYVHASAVWGRRLASPFETIRTISTAPLFYRWFFGAAAVIPICLWLAAFVVKLRISYIVYAFLLLLTYFCANSAEGLPRFVSVVFPLFIVLAILTERQRAMFGTAIAASGAAFTFCTIMTASGYWIT